MQSTKINRLEIVHEDKNMKINSHGKKLDDSKTRAGCLMKWLIYNLQRFVFVFVLIVVLRPGKQFFSHVETEPTKV